MNFSIAPITTCGRVLGGTYGLVTIVFGAALAVGPQVGVLLADGFNSFGPVIVLAAACCVVGVVLTSWPSRTQGDQAA